MSRSLKRKRRSSANSQEDEDYAYHLEKRSRQDTLNSQSNVCVSPLHALQDDLSVHVLHSDIVEQEVVTSECECETCTQHNSEATEILSPRSSEIEPRVETSESELRYRSSSPISHNGYSSCDERILCSEVASSPVAASIVDSDLENDDDDDDNMLEVRDHSDEYDDLDDDEDTLKPNNDSAACKHSCKAVTFMGQLTPGSSVGKVRWGNSDKSPNESDRLYTSELGCPVPQLSWASREKFWEVMCRKDELSLKDRNPDLFDYQEYLKPRMRIILLDWISEVATVFKLHRETYYLTIDYIDRYLSCVPNIPKQQLQLIGVTCLLLASKMEEIYPPKIDQFANVTDGACTEEEIFSMEVNILRHLNWLLTPITVNNWLEMMLQFIYQKLETKNNNLFTPHFSSSLFKKLCQLLDLVTLDITSLRFSYCALAAAAIYILVDPKLAISISGLKKEILEPCVQWMSVYWKVLRETNSSEMDNVNDILNDKSEVYFVNQRPELQTHNISMQLYELVQAEFELIENQKNSQGDNSQILTPPSSSSKSPPTNIPC